MEQKDVILSARDVHVKFSLRGRTLHAIRGVDLDVYRGEVLAIVGESGSGKSVLTKTFMGLLDANGRVSEGTIDYFGRDDGRPKSTTLYAFETPMRPIKSRIASGG